MYYEDETKSRLPAYVCIADAKKRNAANVVLFTDAQIAEGEKLFDQVQSAYFRSRVYRNYREKFIAVKVDAPKTADKISADVAKLNAFCVANNIDIVATKANVVYRIKI